MVQNSANTDATVFLGAELNWEEAGHNSHIDTQIALDNNEELILPLGNAQVFHPLAIHDAANTAVTARYFNQPAPSQTLGVDLTQLANFYWAIAADQPLTISLTWNALSNIGQLTTDLEALVLWVQWNANGKPFPPMFALGFNCPRSLFAKCRKHNL